MIAACRARVSGTPGRSPGADAPRVLLVDDNQMLRELTAALLAEQGFAVTAVGDARAALEALGREPIDAVVTDIRLPGPDGNWLLGCIRGAGGRQPVVAVTGSPERVTTAFDAVLVKPYAPARLGTVVTELLARAGEGR